MEYDKEDLAWCAGFFDGEGTYCATSHKGRPTILVACGQIRREPLERMRDTLKVGQIYGPYDRGGENQRPVYVWQAQGLLAAAIVWNLLWPQLSAHTKEKIEAAWEYVRKSQTSLGKERLSLTLRRMGLSPSLPQSTA